MLWLLDFLSAGGVDTSHLAQKYGLHGLDGSGVLISSSKHRALLLEALYLTKNPGLGLELGFHRSLATYDQLAYLMMSSSTLRRAIEQGLRYQNYPGRFSGDALVTEFRDLGDQGCFEVIVRQDLGELRLLAIEELLSNIVATSRWVLGRPLPVTKLRCDYPVPGHAEKYEAIFDCPVQFNAPSIQLFFNASILDDPLPNASPQSSRLYASLCEEKSIVRARGTISCRIAQLIEETPATPPSMEDVANLVHCSPRTLRRKLKAEGWQYHQLIDSIRVNRARRALEDSSKPITEIAMSLGYADHSGFLRAFKKWTGVSPTEFRKKLFD